MLDSLLLTAARRTNRLAVVGDDWTATYGDLLHSSAVVGRRLLERLPDEPAAQDLRGARIGLLATPGAGWVTALLGIWRAGGHAVPLALAHPEPELEHVLTDADVAAILVETALGDRVQALATRLGLPILALDESEGATRNEADGEAAARILPVLRGADHRERFALLLYTSGTTGRPKGVPIRHRHLEAQLRSLSEAWLWTGDDQILGVLPLHHVHGIVNVVLSALWNGAVCTLHRHFDADRVWRSFEGSGVDDLGSEGSEPDGSGSDAPTLFMAVPTIYGRLADAWRTRPELRQRRGAAAGGLRLMVSGSAALPETTLEAWRDITGHTLVERYGMTEIGMALSQPYDGERDPGTVGGPLPGVEVRLGGPELHPDELEVRGPGVFDGYWRRPVDTESAFTDDGFFRTGDVATTEDGNYRLLGRRNVDILKSGGEKISALEIESVLRHHEIVADAAVVGRDDAEWGQRVVAFVETSDGRSCRPDDLRAWCRERLAAFKVPKSIEIVERLPRNVLGKVMKGRLI